MKDIAKLQTKVDGVKVVIGKPPVWDSVCAAFQVRPERTLFTYGDTIYNPGGFVIPPDLVEHERTHIEQQGGNAEGAALWWGKFLRDPQFRVEQEGRAYGRQLAFFQRQEKDEEKRRKAQERLARSLSSPLYGNCIGFVEAWALIGQYAAEATPL